MDAVIERYKRLYGDGEVLMEKDNIISLPIWLALLLLHRTGIRSKRRRIQRKVLKREVEKAIRLGMEVTS